ncbi:uncharacterized protein LOC111719678 [Sarcophilus harrisii]|uniref:uncharacterized protein LOC111719678 n=1 Tax=Sarcophilus harrisii TaxID=9305 RepID=UPI000C7E27A9|nr:uncharacterized protein LOC111719678 [Sarcophilus harrisii]
MGRKLRTYPEVSPLVQIPQKVPSHNTQSVQISCPPHRIALLSKKDHWSETEKMTCLRHRSLPHKASLVCHKTEPLNNHDDKTKDTYKLPPPHPDYHRVYISPDLSCKTTASVDLFQWGDALMTSSEKSSSIVLPRGQMAKAKHSPYHKAKHTLDSKTQTKSIFPSQDHTKNQATSLPSINQPGRAPSRCQSPTKYLLINTYPGPDSHTKSTMPTYEYLSEAPPIPDAQEITPPNISYQTQMPLEKEEYGILPKLLSTQAKDPISQYYQKVTPPGPIQQTETLTSDYKQVEDAPSSKQPETQPGSQHQIQTEQNRDVLKYLKDIKPYTLEGGITLTTQVVDKIISSIPEEKIKRDICNQIRLWQMRGCPRSTQWPEQHMSASYTICLICASWVPNGCPHVDGMKSPSLAQLLAIPTSLPNSEEKKVRFYLKVSQQKPNPISTVTDSLSTKTVPSSPSSTFPSCPKSDPEHLVLPKVTWLDFILARRHHLKERKPRSSQKPFELPLTSKINVEEMPVRPRIQFKSLLEKFQSRSKS